jgi:hypothetical protein
VVGSVIVLQNDSDHAMARGVYDTDKSGQPATSFQHCVERVVDSRSIVQQSAIACQSGLLRWKYTTRACRLSSLLHGDKRPRPSSRAVNACPNIPTTDSNSWNGIPWS